MISVEEAIALINRNMNHCGEESVSIEKSFGRLLMENIYADGDLPPFDRVMMDGIAVRFEDLKSGSRKFRIAGIQRAGEEQKSLSENHTCLEVMTGCVCPKGADAVIPYELITIQENIASIAETAFKPGMHIHAQGRDKKKGDLLIPGNTIIGSPEIGVFASIGKTMLKVAGLPKSIIFSTGDELVDISSTPESHQIRRSNVYALKSLLEDQGILCSTSHINDDHKSIHEQLHHAMEDYDLIVLTGGVSKGKFDLIPDVLKELGVKEVFHRIAQKPGKPMWFGVKDHLTVFAFPGNPVSSMVCAVRYLVPWIQSSFFQTCLQQEAILTEEILIKPGLTHFVLVKIISAGAVPRMVQPEQGNGSGDFVSMVNADGFVELKGKENAYMPGDKVPFFPLR